MPQPERVETLVLGSGNGGMYLAWHMARSGGVLPSWSAAGLAAPALTSTAFQARMRFGARRSPTWCITAQASAPKQIRFRSTYRHRVAVTL